MKEKPLDVYQGYPKGVIMIDWGPFKDVHASMLAEDFWRYIIDGQPIRMKLRVKITGREKHDFKHFRVIITDVRKVKCGISLAFRPCGRWPKELKHHRSLRMIFDQQGISLGSI